MVWRILKWVLGVIVVVLGGGLAFLSLRSPDMRQAPSIKVESTPERVARGKYLFRIDGCFSCHSVTDQTRFGFPVTEGGLGEGQPMPQLPGTIASANLTSDPETGAARFTDGQLIRAIREGIGHDDRVLFPMMPYSEYREMSDEDVQSLVAYIRTLPPIRNALPPSKVMFPVNLFIKSLPKVVESIPSPDRSDPKKYGQYLTKVNGCYFCHTPFESNKLVESKPFAGGHIFELGKDARVATANLTQDMETGIGKWTEDQFLAKFAEYKDYAANGPPQIDLVHNTVMPWIPLTEMPQEDLKAVFAYLRTVPAINNAIVIHPDAPEEKKK
jgi:mono/diheme cytochrome c family protein